MKGLYEIVNETTTMDIILNDIDGMNTEKQIEITIHVIENTIE